MYLQHTSRFCRWDGFDEDEAVMEMENEGKNDEDVAWTVQI